MKLTKYTPFAGSIFLFGALALTAGCGYKTDPVPPQTVVPKAIEDLRYTLDDKGARLSWSFPVETVSGKDLQEVLNFELFRAEIPLADFCSNCPIPFGDPMVLPGGVTAGETRNSAEHVSGLLRSGNKYFFKVRSRTSWWAASGDSNIVSFVYHTPAAAPQGLKASVSAGGVQLSWAPVKTLLDGSSADLPLSYQVFKSEDGTQFAPVGAPLAKTRYTDSQVSSGKTYFYRVESAMTYEGEMLDGSTSKVVSAKVLDTEPPARVTGVTVIESVANIRVFWDSSNAADLAGYRIYRRLDTDKNPVKIGEVGPNLTIFIDKEIPADVRVFYAVTAIDEAGNESKPSREATTRR